MAVWHVVWEINLDAPTAEEAAREALVIQRDPRSLATIFVVTPFKEPPSPTNFSKLIDAAKTTGA